MKKRSFTLLGMALLGVLFVVRTYAQTNVNMPYNTGQQTIQTTGYLCYYDNGGPAANYSNNSNFNLSILTFAPVNAGAKVRATFVGVYNTETNWDALYVRDGNSTAAPLIPGPAGALIGGTGPAGGWTGTLAPDNTPNSTVREVIATGANATGALTFQFASDASVTVQGWTAIVAEDGPNHPASCGFPAGGPAPINVSTGTADCQATVTLNVPTTTSPFCTSNMSYRINGGAPIAIPAGATTVQVTVPRGNNVVSFGFTTVACGASLANSVDQIVNVVDLVPPAIVCPSSTTINLLPGECTAAYAYSVTATDNCPSTATYSHIALNTPFTPNQALSCGGSPSHHFQVAGVTTSLFVPTSVRVAINSAWAGNTTLTARIYSLNNAAQPYNVSAANRTLLVSSAAFAVPAGSQNQFRDIPIATAVNIPAGTTLLLEVQQTGAQFCVNTPTSTGTSWLAAPACGFPVATPVTYASIGFGTMNALMGIIGNAPLQVEQVSGLPSGVLYPIGTTCNVWKSTDASNNVSTCSWCVTVNEYPFATTTLACNDFIQISVDEDCQTVIGADQILEGGPYGCYDDYIVELDRTAPYGNGPWTPATIGPGDIGKTYAVRVTDPETGNSCWGNVKIEDKIDPVLVCPTTSAYCNDEPYAAGVLSPVSSYTAFGNVPVAVPAGATINLPVNLGSGTVADADLSIRITGNTFFGNMTVALRSPSGTQTNLITPLFGCGGFVPMDIIFDADAPFSILCVDFQNGLRRQPLAGVTANPGALNIFDGQNAAGNWQVIITNTIGGGMTVERCDLLLTLNNGTVGATLPNGLVLNGNAIPAGNNTFIVPAGQGTPVVEYCSDVTLSYLDTETAANCASGFTKVINRKWTAVDASGNTETCIQTVNIIRPSLNDLVAPPNYDDLDEPALECNSAYPTPAFLESTGRQGFPYFFGEPDGCSIGYDYHDIVLDVCDGTYKISRKWTIIDWCTSEQIEYVQIIKVLDDQGPVFDCPANITISTDPYQCCATTNLPDVIVEDGCSRINNLSGMIIGIDPFTNDTIGMFPIGGTLTDFPGNNHWDLDTLANFGTTPCLPIGTHTVVYVAEDDCGNTSSCTFRLTVRDYTPPNVACDEFTVVSIGVDDPADCYEPSADGCQFAGVTWVNASTFDDGSYDNCNNLLFTVQRMQPYSDCILGLNQINGHPDCDDIFADFPSEFERAIGEAEAIKFYCCEVGTTQTVIFRAYQVDANGNFMFGADGFPIFNECMVQVEVQDKIKPVCQAPANVTVSCENFDPSLWAYGNATVYDNCCLDSTVSYLGQKGLSHVAPLTNFDTTCNKGTIIRRWTARDCYGLTSQCTQRVIVTYEQDYWVKFPADKILLACDSSSFEQPTFFGEDCELLAVSYHDDLFTVVPDACYKIERTWSVINWCTYNPNLPCVYVPNPNPNPNVNSPQNLPGPTVSACGNSTPGWNPTVVKINPTDPVATNFCTFWDADANCYQYKQIIKVVDNEDPIVTNCPASPVEICDYTPNDPLFWNEMYWWDNSISSHDLCEAPTDLTITATDACGGSDLKFRYLLFLDLDQSGDMETVISSTNLPGYNNVKFGNANTPNYTGGTDRAFDGRPVPFNQKWGFAMQVSAQVQGNPNRTASVRWNTLQSPNSYVVPQLPYGTHKIKWFVEDGCGNETICEYVFIVKDCKAPTVVCINGLSVNIMPTQMIALWASDFLQYTEDNCTPTDQIKIGIRRKGQGTGFPTNPDGSPQTGVNFTCLDLGTQFVELWGQDVAGNADYCETYVIVQDNGGFCSNSAVTVAGDLQTATQQGLESAEVELNGSHPALPPINMFDNSGNDGSYMFPAAVPTAGTYTVTPTKDDDHLNGVSTFDLVLINKHILGIESFDSPFKMIAADANNSKSITTFDIAELRKLILGIYTELPNNTSWRFVDAAYTFPNPDNPFVPAFPETKSVADVQASQLEDNFVSMKIGDVNGSAIANSFMSADDRTAGTLLFDVEDRDVKVGEEVVVNFKATEKVTGYQFTMNFAGLEVVDVTPGAEMSLANFGVFADAITTSFDADVTGEFAVKFRATQAGKLSSMLGVSSRVTKAEAYSKGGDRLDVAFRFNGQNGSTISGVGFELYQNMPNPFVSKTVIGFHLPEAAEATLTIFDETGRMIYTVNGDFAKGHNAISLDRAQINTTGVLYYKLETANNSATKKMIQTK